VAVILALLVTALLGALGVTLLLVSDTERRLSSNYRDDQESRYAAAAGLERALAELDGAADWDSILAGRLRSTFEAGTHRPTLASGQPVDLDAITSDLDAGSNGGASFGANTPVWRLFSWGPLAALQAAGQVRSAQYLAVWVADDLSDSDGSPSADSNGILTVHAEAFGFGGGRRAVEATVERINGLLRMISWREL
jgi:hypothetical protein